MTPTPKQPKPDNIHRVFRGGSWNFPSATYVRAAYRDDSTPSIRYINIGFRTVQSGCRQPLKEANPP